MFFFTRNANLRGAFYNLAKKKQNVYMSISWSCEVMILLFFPPLLPPTSFSLCFFLHLHLRLWHYESTRTTPIWPTMINRERWGVWERKYENEIVRKRACEWSWQSESIKSKTSETNNNETWTRATSSLSKNDTLFS